MDKDELLKKWLNDELTPAEKETFEQGDDSVLHQAILDGAQHFKSSNFSHPEAFGNFKLAYEAKTSRTKKSNWINPILRIAAALIIGFGIYFTMFDDHQTHIQTMASQKTTIELPDQSKVTLNAGSEIEYNKKDWKNNRRLELKGEAYFRVAKGKTFDVKTSQGVVTVVGTEFNVKQRERFFEVQCFEGIVSVTSDDLTKTLLAGDTFRVLDDTFTQDKTAFLEPEWIKNTSTFKALPFQEVIAELERQYNIKIIVENVNTERLFTGGFMHNHFENALFSITEPMDLSYKVNASNDVVIYGNKK